MKRKQNKTYGRSSIMIVWMETKFDRGVKMDILHSPNIACARVDAQLLD